MKKVFEYANEYVKKCNWIDMALLKICLCAVGVMIGLSVPENKKKLPFTTAGVIFAASYIPLMIKFIKIIMQKRNETQEFTK